MPPCAEDTGGDTGGTSGGSSSPIDPAGNVWVNAASGTTVVDRGFLDDLFDGTLNFDGEATVLTERTDEYYELSGVTAGSLADALGFQNGDVPQTLNGIVLKDASYVQAYFELTDASTTSVSVRVLRPTGVVVLSFEIQ